MIRTHKIADNIHGLINISQIEKNIISTNHFNRLHNINQHSVLYLTFPSVRVKRFEHSIGTMHLAGEFYYSAILNTINKGNSVFESYIDLAKKRISNIHSIKNKYDEKDFSKILEELLDRKDVSSDGFYRPFRLNKCVSNERESIFILLLQSIRIVGLLHDVGHPPYSHIVENAINKVYNILILEATERVFKNNSFEKSNEFLKKMKRDISKQSNYYYGIVVQLIKDSKLDKTVVQDFLSDEMNNGEYPFFNSNQFDITKFLNNQNYINYTSEQVETIKTYIGGYFKKLLGEDDLFNSRQQVFLDSYNCFFGMNREELHEEIGLKISEEILRNLQFDNLNSDMLFIVRNIVESILSNKNNFFKHLHLLVDGDLDVDRLDYVSREQYSSGISNSITNYKRLRDSITIYYDSKYNFSFDSKAIPDIDDFFIKRFVSWQKMIYHHRSTKMAKLLEECTATIIQLSFDSSQKTNTDLISKLWESMDEKDISLSGWDDNWFWSTIFTIYMNLKDKKKLPNNLKPKLVELMTNKKNYISLIKRFEEFTKMEEIFLKRLELKKKDLKDIETEYNSIDKVTLNEKPVILRVTLKEIFEKKGKDLFDYCVFTLLDNTALGFSIDDFFGYVKNELEGYNGIEEVLLAKVKLKTGIDDKVKIKNKYKTRLCEYSCISNVDDFLKRKIKNFPKFYVYCLTDDEFTYDNQINILEKIGRLIFNWLIMKTKAMVLDLKN